MGSLVFWRLAIAGSPGCDGRNRARKQSSARLCRVAGQPSRRIRYICLRGKTAIVRLSVAQPDKLLPLPVRVAFAYKKKKDRREYLRVTLKRAEDGEIEANKHQQDGAGILTSLTETDGLLELPEDVTAVEPGARAGFLSYAALVGG